MSIEKLRVLAETTLDDYPDASIERFVKDAVEEYDELRELFKGLAYSTVISDNAILVKPKVYNKMVKIFNKHVATSTK